MLATFLKPAIVESGCFNKGLPGGPYGHYVLRIPRKTAVEMLDAMADGQAGDLLKSRAIIDGHKGFPRLFGFPVEWNASCEKVELVPLEAASRETLVAVVRALSAPSLVA